VSSTTTPSDSPPGRTSHGHGRSGARFSPEFDAKGLDWCRRHSDATDDWLRALFHDATGNDSSGIALVAVGGYGRAELFPGSDLDVVLLHERRDVATIADRIWYPIWDAGAHLSHSVRTDSQTLTLARHDLDTATSLLSARCIAGDEALSTALSGEAVAQWRRSATRWLGLLADRVEVRQARSGEVAFLLEPDLKSGRGGLRDVHAMRWAEATRRLLFEPDDLVLDRAYAVLGDARVELQRRTGSASNVLTLEDQDAVADALGYRDADSLMAAISDAARAIAWTSDDMWRRIRSSLSGPSGRLARRDRAVRPGVVLRDGELRVDADVLRTDPSLPLQVARAAAVEDVRIGRDALALLASGSPPLPDPWPPVARGALVDLLLTGHRAIPVIEALDHVGVWVHILPEWSKVRCRPQRNAYHRFTVDRHLVEAAANAGERAAGVSRPDLLVIGALLHDIGKGYPGDHTEAGVEVVPLIAARMGFDQDDIDTLVCLVAHHLLLAEVATRRDLDDPGTIDHVATLVGTTTRLELLALLTEADSLATGPSAWSAWKAGLIGDLVERTRHVLQGGAVADVAFDHGLTDEQQALLDRRRLHLQGKDSEFMIVAEDEARLFARVAGVLTVHGAAVLAASAHSDDGGWVLDQFTVDREGGRAIDWDAVTADVERVLRDPAALDPRIERRLVSARQRPARAANTLTTVRFDNDVSANATVIDVHAADRIGLLYRISEAIADAGLDIRSAKVQTMGPHAVDSFYVRDREGAKLTDDVARTALEQNIIGALHG
jgi:[protein-PII] uridylyltransferase